MTKPLLVCQMDSLPRINLSGNRWFGRERLRQTAAYPIVRPPGAAATGNATDSFMVSTAIDSFH